MLHSYVDIRQYCKFLWLEALKKGVMRPIRFPKKFGNGTFNLQKLIPVHEEIHGRHDAYGENGFLKNCETDWDNKQNKKGSVTYLSRWY